MISKGSKLIVLLFLIINFNILLCCDTSTFIYTPIIVVQGDDAENSVTKTINVTGCIDGKDDYGNIRLIRGHHTPPIPVLREGAIANLANVTTIFFKFNNISEIEPGSFKNLPKLDILAITNNTITEIKTNTFSDLPIKILILAYNKINQIDLKAFTNMPKLDSLYLNDNDLKFLYRTWFYKTDNLKTIILTNNKLASLPSRAFVNTPLIEILGFTKNLIAKVHPTAFDGLTSLKELDLSKNLLKELPPNIFSSIENCEFVYLNGNNLTFLYEEQLNDLKYLTALTIHSNPMQCTCMFHIQKWAKKNRIELDTFHRDCILPENPVCINPETHTRICHEAVQEDLIDLFYKDFKHPPRHCDDDPFDL